MAPSSFPRSGASKQPRAVQTVTAVAKATVIYGATLGDLVTALGEVGPSDQLTMAHAYFSEWRKSAPFMPDSMQDIPRRWTATEPEPLEDFLEDWRRVIRSDEPTE